MGGGGGEANQATYSGQKGGGGSDIRPPAELKITAGPWPFSVQNCQWPTIFPKVVGPFGQLIITRHCTLW